VVGVPIRVPIASIAAALLTLTMVTAVATAAVFVATPRAARRLQPDHLPPSRSGRTATGGAALARPW